MNIDILPIGERPPLGVVPSRMHAWTVRPERYGEPRDSFRVEAVAVPEIADDEVLVYVMAAGVNYNNIWAGRGLPVDVVSARQKAGEKEDFHVGGSDASGVVYKVGRNVTTLKVGDEVVVHCGRWDASCPLVKRGVDPMYSPTYRIWGYETNWGSFAQLTKVQAHQCLPKPAHLTWEAAAAYMLVGATAYRMLLGWPEHQVQQGDVVLVWGGAGGLGSMAIQIAKSRGALPVAVVSGDEVSKDHVIKWQGKLYEAPCGLSGRKIQVRHHLLDGRLSVIHGDKDVTLSELDQVRNATARRAQRRAPEAPQSGDLPVPKTAATRAFERDFGSILADDGVVVVEAKGRSMTKSGKPYHNSYCLVFHLLEGKIKEITEYCDTALIEAVL